VASGAALAISALSVPGEWARRVTAALLGLLVGLVFIVSFVAYVTAARWVHPARTTIATTPAAVGMTYDDVKLTTEDGLRLAAWYMPSTNRAALIMLHGLGGNRANDLDLARELVDHGYGVLVPDLRAHGDSEGAVCTLGVTEVRDVRAAVRYLQEQPDVDADRIGVYGASLGGATAIMAGAEIPELRAVATYASFSSIEWVVRNQFSRLESVPDWLAPLVVGMGSWQAGVSASDIAPVRQIRRISPRPVMIMHGQLDQFFVVENARLLFEAAQQPKELWIDQGVGHQRQLGTDGVYLARLLRFFDNALGSKWPSATSVSADDHTAVSTAGGHPNPIL
jgi:dipeptidyl aminopeptidase/acylaminoacyl peptidase